MSSGIWINCLIILDNYIKGYKSFKLTFYTRSNFKKKYVLYFIESKILRFWFICCQNNYNRFLTQMILIINCEGKANFFTNFCIGPTISFCYTKNKVIHSFQFLVSLIKILLHWCSVQVETANSDKQLPFQDVLVGDSCTSYTKWMESIIPSPSATIHCLLSSAR